MKNLILTGMMGAGKTTCGRLLAQALGRVFVDMDTVIEQQDGRPIPGFLQSRERPFSVIWRRLWPNSLPSSPIS